MSIKSERIASDLVKELTNILLTESNDELFKTVTITYATVTNDLSFSKVYFTTLDDDKVKVEKELNEASTFFRTLLADRLKIRHMPAIKFIFDESIEYGNKIENIISNLNK